MQTKRGSVRTCDRAGRGRSSPRQLLPRLASHRPSRPSSINSPPRHARSGCHLTSKPNVVTVVLFCCWRCVVGVRERAGRLWGRRPGRRPVGRAQGGLLGLVLPARKAGNPCKGERQLSCRLLASEPLEGLCGGRDGRDGELSSTDRSSPSATLVSCVVQVHCSTDDDGDLKVTASGGVVVSPIGEDSTVSPTLVSPTSPVAGGRSSPPPSSRCWF